MTTGVMTPGIAIEARTAESSGPRWNQTSRRARRSVATAVNGIGRSSISWSPTSSLDLGEDPLGGDRAAGGPLRVEQPERSAR